MLDTLAIKYIKLGGFSFSSCGLSGSNRKKLKGLEDLVSSTHIRRLTATYNDFVGSGTLLASVGQVTRKAFIESS